MCDDRIRCAPVPTQTSATATMRGSGFVGTDEWSRHESRDQVAATRDRLRPAALTFDVAVDAAGRPDLTRRLGEQRSQRWIRAAGSLQLLTKAEVAHNDGQRRIVNRRSAGGDCLPLAVAVIFSV